MSPRVLSLNFMFFCLFAFWAARLESAYSSLSMITILLDTIYDIIFSSFHIFNLKTNIITFYFQE